MNDSHVSKTSRKPSQITRSLWPPMLPPLSFVCVQWWAPKRYPNVSYPLHIIHRSFVGELLGKRHVILRPISRTCSPLIPTLFLVKDFFQVASEDLAEYFIWIETVWAIRKLPFQCAMEVYFLCPPRNLDQRRNEWIMRRSSNRALDKITHHLLRSLVFVLIFRLRIRVTFLLSVRHLICLHWG